MVSPALVEELVAALPEVEEGARLGNRTWFVRGKAFAWERPFSQADVKRLGSEPVPSGPILAVCVADLHEKEAVLAAGHRGIFTIPHLDGSAAVLIQLEDATKTVVGDSLVDAWLAVAPRKLTDEYAAARLRRRR